MSKAPKDYYEGMGFIRKPTKRQPKTAAQQVYPNLRSEYRPPIQGDQHTELKGKGR